jgi:uncharacterized membrane protein (UPF0127 family)
MTIESEIEIEIKIARHFWSRAIGLLGRRALGAHQGLLITACDSVRTCLMRWPIDVVFIDRAGNITRIVEHLQPWRWAAARHPAHAGLEIQAGNAALLGLHVGLCLPQLAQPASADTVRLDVDAALAVRRGSSAP